MSTKDENKSKANGIDLAAISQASDAGEFMQLANPGTGELLNDEDGNPIGINLLGRDSDEYRKAQRSITNRRLQSRANQQITAERLEAEANEILAACTVSWDGIVFEGAPLDCNLQNAKKLYTKLPWVKEQVDSFITERANFLGH